MYKYLFTLLFLTYTLLAEYSVKLGKFSNKASLDAKIASVNKNLQSEIEVTYHSPYYFAKTKSYPTKEMANVKKFILGQYFHDAFITEEKRNAHTPAATTNKPKATPNPYYVDKRKEKKQILPQETQQKQHNLFNAIKPQEYQNNQSSPLHPRKETKQNIEIKNDIHTYNDRGFVTHPTIKASDNYNNEKSRIRLARFSNQASLKQMITKLPASYQNEVRLYKEHNSVIATTIAYTNRQVASQKLPTFKRVFHDAFIQQAGNLPTTKPNITKPRPPQNTTSTPSKKTDTTPYAQPSHSSGFRVRLGKYKAQTALQSKVASLPTSTRSDVRIFKVGQEFVATTIIYPTKQIASSKLLAFRQSFTDAYLSDAGLKGKVTYTPGTPRNNSFLNSINPFSDSSDEETPTSSATNTSGKKRGSGKSLWERINPFSNEEDQTPQDLTEPQTSSTNLNTPSDLYNHTYFVVRLAKFSHQQPLKKKIALLSKTIQSQVSIYKEDNYYIAQSKPYTNKDDAQKALSHYQAVFNDAYVKTILPSNNLVKEPIINQPTQQNKIGTTIQTYTTLPSEETIYTIGDPIDNVAPKANFIHYTNRTMRKLNTKSLPSTQSYVIRLGKFKSKQNLEKEINKLGKIKTKTQLTKEGDYYIALSLPYALRHTAQNDLGKYRTVFSDAFIQSTFPSTAPNQKELHQKTRFNHRKLQHITNPEEIVFKQSSKILHDYGTSQVNGKVHYTTTAGKPIKLKNTKAYLVSSTPTLTRWYKEYYLKNKRSNSMKQVVAQFIVSTQLSADNSFSFYGVAKGKYFLIIQADYPRNIAKDQHVYLAKEVEVGEYKKLSTVFTKQL